MPVDFLAGETHYLDHLYPIWQALPKKQRGTILLVKASLNSDCPSRLRNHAWNCRYEGCAAFPDIARAQDAIVWLREHQGLVVTASVNDARLVEKSGRPQVFCEHGAGQSYSSHHPSYAGGTTGRRIVKLFLCPNEGSAQRNRDRYPAAVSLAIGCPKLDAWHQQPPKPRGTPPVVGLSFHWDCGKVCPEAGWAWPHYRNHLLPLIRDRRWQFIGHGHPRALPALCEAYTALGIETVEGFPEVVARADCYVIDNSSTLFEFASLGRPVVVLNAPWYRRNVNHGLRFWAAANVGVQCNEPGDLPAAIALALEDRPEQQAARAAAVALAYAYTDGKAAQRAAQAILEIACLVSQSRLIPAMSSMSSKPRSASPATSRARCALSSAGC